MYCWEDMLRKMFPEVPGGGLREEGQPSCSGRPVKKAASLGRSCGLGSRKKRGARHFGEAQLALISSWLPWAITRYHPVL